ncbi:hypothetical protein M3Y97_00950200 [Aphelenchoides bicaudatus]|nr:hypothetical protein M3Y97_00950200 [Aphelenchoides bicaudatus]
MERFQTSAEQRQCPSKRCYFTLLSSSLAIDVSVEDGEQSSLYLIECNSLKKRQLHLIDNLPMIKDVFVEIFALNDTQFLINAFLQVAPSSDVIELHTLYLMEINEDNLTCRLLDAKKFLYDILSIAKDINCPDKFCLFGENVDMETRYCLQRCCLNNSRIEVETNIMALDSDQFGYAVTWYEQSFQLNGDEMRGLMHIINRNTDNPLVMVNVKMNESHVSIKKCFEFEFPDKYNDAAISARQSFAWYGHRLIVLLKAYAYVFLEINAETETTNLFYSSITLQHHSCRDFCVDDGILLICGRMRETKQHLYYRLPLR